MRDRLGRLIAFARNAAVAVLFAIAFAAGLVVAAFHDACDRIDDDLEYTRPSAVAFGGLAAGFATCLTVHLALDLIHALFN